MDDTEWSDLCDAAGQSVVLPALEYHDCGAAAGRRRIGVTAGASAPEVLVESVIARLKELGAGSVRQLEGVPERVTFPLPKELQVTN